MLIVNLEQHSTAHRVRDVFLLGRTQSFCGDADSQRYVLSGEWSLGDQARKKPH